MGGNACSSPTRRMARSFMCVCTIVAVATIVVMFLLVDFVALSGAFPHTPSISNHFEALSNSRLILKEWPNTLSTIQRTAGFKLRGDENGVNNKVDFTDSQFAETVEEQYEKIISSQKWLRQRVDWEEHGLEKAPEIKFDIGSQELTATIFSAPQAFTGSESDMNRQALLSWLHLSPRPHVVLLGNHSSLHKMAEEFPGLVTVEPRIDYSCTGLPLFNSMVARAHAVDTNVAVLIKPNVILLQDFMPGLRKLSATFTDWALVSQRLEISDLPFRFAHKGGGIVFLEHSVTGESMIDRELSSFVRTSGKLQLREGVNVWAWTVAGDGPLFASPMPSFTYGAGYHDQWMARGLAQGARIVVDATDALVGFHVLEPRVVTLDETVTTRLWNLAGKEWQSIVNLYLYRKHRDISAEEKNLLSGGWKLIGCPDPSMIKLCISETHSAANPCRCENIFSRPVSGARYAETFLEKEARLRLEVIRIPTLGTTPESPFLTLDQLLSLVADAKKNVVLVGANSPDKDMLWSFTCRARSLGVTNLLVAAFDKDVYKSALVRGIPVLYSGPVLDQEDDQSRFDNSTSQLKLQLILHVLQRGYNVLWSDADVLWFQNPLPRVTTYPTGTLVVESDEPNINLPANAPGRVSPGFFYAQSEKATIKTFRDLVKSARDSSQPEQLLFSHALCGVRAQRRVGVAECKAATGLRTSFLNRRLFSNGIVNGYWLRPNLTHVAASNGVYVLHNNWIHEKEDKVRRLKAKLVWFYDDVHRMCVHPWQRRRNGNEHPVGNSKHLGYR